MIFTLARLDLKRLFLSPLAWSALVAVQLILALLFLINLEGFLEAQSDLAAMQSPDGVTALVAGPLIGNAALVLLFVTPLFAMRLIAEERRNRTLPLLLSAPVTLTALILGRFLGLALFLWLMVVLTALMPAALVVLAGAGTLDYGLFAAQLLGLGLITAAYSATGLFVSTLTRHPATAAAGTLGALLALWLIAESGGGAVTEWLSLAGHLAPFLRGIVDTRDLAWFGILIALMLGLAAFRLDQERAGS